MDSWEIRLIIMAVVMSLLLIVDYVSYPFNCVLFNCYLQLGILHLQLIAYAANRKYQSFENLDFLERRPTRRKPLLAHKYQRMDTDDVVPMASYSYSDSKDTGYNPYAEHSGDNSGQTLYSREGGGQ